MMDDQKQEIDAVDLSGKRGDPDHVKLGQPADHWHLHAVCICLPTDYEPYGYRVRDNGSDCSCGCVWFLPLQAHPADWGVCSNPQSPRCGLLTFEHQGCAFFTPGRFEEKDKKA
jgi:hypothetical protein